MSTAVMSLGTLQQLQPAKKMVMMLSPPHDVSAHIVQPSNGACVIVSANAYPTASPPHFTNLDAHAAHAAHAAANNNNAKAKNNNLNKVSRAGGGGAVQKATVAASRTSSASVVVTATATTTTTSSSSAASSAAAEALRCKRRIQFSQGVSFSGHQTASVARRNARERNRVKQVNNGFATLRSHIPPAIAAALQEESPSPVEKVSGRSSAKDKEAAKKLSKVETLRMAVEYIRRLQSLLSDTNDENAAPGSPVTVKSESVGMPDSPGNGFDADYEAALALSHYSMAADSSSSSTASSVGGLPHGAATATVLGLHHPHFVSLSPPCSDAGSAGSPTPSYVSDGSAGASSTGYAPAAYGTPAPAHPHHHGGGHPGHCRPTHLGHSPATPPDSAMYEPMSPEDEELLDVISWWQQSN